MSHVGFYDDRPRVVSTAVCRSRPSNVLGQNLVQHQPQSPRQKPVRRRLLFCRERLSVARHNKPVDGHVIAAAWRVQGILPDCDKTDCAIFTAETEDRFRHRCPLFRRSVQGRHSDLRHTKQRPAGNCSSRCSIAPYVLSPDSLFNFPACLRAFEPDPGATQVNRSAISTFKGVSVSCRTLLCVGVSARPASPRHAGTSTQAVLLCAD
jgi:hypothetical protein